MARCWTILPAPISTTPNVLNSFEAPLALTGNQLDEIEVSGSNVTTQSIQIADFGIPYQFDGMEIRNDLEILAGVEIKMTSDSEIDVDSLGGTLKISGTPDNPVLITGVDPTPGSWNGIEYSFSNSANNTISNATIEFGGSGTNGANLTTQSNTTNPTRIGLENVTLRNSSNRGFRFANGTTITGFEGVVSTANGSSGEVAVNQVGGLSSNSFLTGNAIDELTVNGSVISDAQTWSTLDVPYFLDDGLDVRTALQLSPGSTLIFASGEELDVDTAGSLTAIGTPTAPITFTGAEPLAGFWEGIRFANSFNTMNVLDNVVVQYGGQGTATNNGNIEMSCTSTNPSNLSLSNAQILDSGSWGVFLAANGCNLTLGENVIFARNASGDMNMP